MSALSRSLTSELNKLIDKKVIVKLNDNRRYTGKLITIDPSSLNLVLADAEADDGSKYHRVVLSGAFVKEIILPEQPLFIAEEFAEFLARRLPTLGQQSIKVISEINAVEVAGRVRVRESGVEGSGMLAERVNEVFNEYIERKKKGIPLV